MEKLFHSKNNGFAIVEALISVGIAASLVVTFTTFISKNIKVNYANTKEVKANFYLQELIEVARDLEQSDWSEITAPLCASPNICHTASSLGAWQFLAGAENLENKSYSRSVTIEDVYRSVSTFPNTIVDSTIPGAVLDPNTKKITATISWYDGFQNRSSTLETYVYQMP